MAEKNEEMDEGVKKNKDEGLGDNKNKEAEKDTGKDSLSPTTRFVDLGLSSLTHFRMDSDPNSVFLGSLKSPPLFGANVGVGPLQFAGNSVTWHPIKLGQDLEDEIADLRKKNRDLVRQIEEKAAAEQNSEKEIDALRQQLMIGEREARDRQRLQHLMHRVHPAAWKRLREDEAFRKLFEQKSSCSSIIMSIDIRRSTELMLKAKDAESYQRFIVDLCDRLQQIILDNYGVFDKFTGDGVLAFFPEFYSGEDCAYLAIKSAGQCHAFFAEHYRAHRSSFTTVLKNVGLGIGIDYGEVHLVNVRDWLTVIGTPVVYACRLSGAEAGQTLLNQQAYDVVSQRFAQHVNLHEASIEIKHEETAIAYAVSLAGKSYKPATPKWIESGGRSDVAPASSG